LWRSYPDGDLAGSPANPMTYNAARRAIKGTFLIFAT